MKQIERFNLIDRIGRELQSRMTFDDIDIYLAGFNVPPADRQKSYSSKWVYSKNRLKAIPDDVVVSIADDLELPHPHVVVPGADVGESRFWDVGSFRLFLSHLSTFKGKAAALQRALRSYNITAFVAHLDIRPTRDWQDEIERALFSMDALAAILMPGFKESNWTDQEVGVAVGRGVPVIPILKGLNPYGFIAKYQGFDVGSRTVGQVAMAVFEILLANDRTGNKMWTAFVDSLLLVCSEEAADEKVSILESLADRSRTHLARLREGAPENPILSGEAVKRRVNDVLRAESLSPIPAKPTVCVVEEDDELPF